MLSKSHIGRLSEEREIAIERGQLKLFAKAIGETNPVYFNVEFAKKQGYPDLLAPPTFGSCLRLLAPAEELSYESLGIDYKRLLHAEESFEYYLPLYANDEVVLQGEVIDIFDKKGGALQFLVMQTEIKKNQKLAQVIRGTLVMKEATND